jgi:hypothetical protein
MDQEIPSPQREIIQLEMDLKDRGGARDRIPLEMKQRKRRRHPYLRRVNLLYHASAETEPLRTAASSREDPVQDRARRTDTVSQAR